jgi:hypothetical protein
MSKPRSNGEPEVTTYFQLQRNRDSLSEVGESKVGGDISSLPELPASSPWGSGGMPSVPDEPTSREDSDTTDMTED